MKCSHSSSSVPSCTVYEYNTKNEVACLHLQCYCYWIQEIKRY